MALATIILPNFNNERVLPHTFDCLRRNVDCSQAAFVMVDDGSEDTSVAIAKKLASECRFASCEIIEGPHVGIVAALNTALAAVKTEIVVRIDGDATVETAGWLPKLCAWLNHSEVGMAGGHVIWETGNVHSFGRSVISEFGLFDMGCAPLEPAGHRTFDSLVYRPKSAFDGGKPYEVDTILGVCVAFRRSDAQAAGGFDMTFNPVWIEDDDFGIALRKLGKRLIIDPSVHIVHRPSLRGSRQPGVVAANKSSAEPAPNMDRPDLANLFKGGVRRILRAGNVLIGKPEKREEKAAPAPALEDLFPKETNSWRCGILKSHYASWAKKWDFCPLNPNMTEIFNRYWDSALCWGVNPALRIKSEAFLRKAVASLK
jgi:GT2 family glycosyltransferase